MNRSSIQFRPGNGLCPNVLTKQPAAKLSDPNTMTAQVVKLTGKYSAWLAPNHAAITAQSTAWSNAGYIQSRNLIQFAITSPVRMTNAIQTVISLDPTHP